MTKLLDTTWLCFCKVRTCFSQLSDFFNKRVILRWLYSHLIQPATQQADRTPNQPHYCKTEKVELLSKHSTKFPGCFKGFPKKIEGCLERVLMVFHGYFSSKVVSRKFHGCFKKVSRMFQGRFKSVSKEFKRWLLKD